MKPTTPDRIRNVALISHGGAGKTSLAEAMLFDAGAIQRLGSVDAGHRRRSTTTPTSRSEAEHQPGDRRRWRPRGTDHAGRHARLRRLPGDVDRGAGGGRCRDRGRAMPSPACEVGTEAVWRMADERKLPRFVFINKMDRENANFDAALDQLKAASVRRSRPVYLPIGSRRVVPRLRRRDRAARQRLRERQADGGADPRRAASRRGAARGARRWSRPRPRRATS